MPNVEEETHDGGKRSEKGDSEGMAPGDWKRKALDSAQGEYEREECGRPDGTE